MQETIKTYDAKMAAQRRGSGALGCWMDAACNGNDRWHLREPGYSRGNALLRTLRGSAGPARTDEYRLRQSFTPFEWLTGSSNPFPVESFTFYEYGVCVRETCNEKR